MQISRSSKREKLEEEKIARTLLEKIHCQKSPLVSTNDMVDVKRIKMMQEEYSVER